MGADRFLGLLDWFMGRQKPTKHLVKKPVTRKRSKPKYLVTFEVQEREYASITKHTFILKSDVEQWLTDMKKLSHNVTVTFMTKI